MDRFVAPWVVSDSFNTHFLVENRYENVNTDVLADEKTAIQIKIYQESFLVGVGGLFANTTASIDPPTQRAPVASVVRIPQKIPVLVDNEYGMDISYCSPAIAWLEPLARTHPNPGAKQLIANEYCMHVWFLDHVRKRHDIIEDPMSYAQVIHILDRTANATHQITKCRAKKAETKNAKKKEKKYQDPIPTSERAAVRSGIQFHRVVLPRTISEYKSMSSEWYLADLSRCMLEHASSANHSNCAVRVEDYIYHADNSSSVTQLCEVSAVFRHHMFLSNPKRSIRKINTKKAKKYFGGDGRCDKWCMYTTFNTFFPGWSKYIQDYFRWTFQPDNPKQTIPHPIEDIVDAIALLEARL